MQCFDSIAAREISGQPKIEVCETLASRHRSGECGDWAVLDHYTTGEASYYAFHQLTSVDALSAMILLEPQLQTPQGRPQNASSIVAVLLRFASFMQYLEDSLERRLRVGFATAQHIAGAAVMAFPRTPCGQEPLLTASYCRVRHKR
jgi:hypothetical protein